MVGDGEEHERVHLHLDRRERQSLGKKDQRRRRQSPEARAVRTSSVVAVMLELRSGRQLGEVQRCSEVCLGVRRRLCSLGLRGRMGSTGGGRGASSKRREELGGRSVCRGNITAVRQPASRLECRLGRSRA
jgi:hypothetical protein